MPSRGPRAALIAAFSCLAVAAVAAWPQQAPTFTAANRTVAVYATVTDAGGRLIPDLERQLFEVDDNGKRQELTIFVNDIQPITGGDAAGPQRRYARTIRARRAGCGGVREKPRCLPTVLVLGSSRPAFRSIRASSRRITTSC